MNETETVLALATRVAREAGDIQRRRYETELDVQTKSASIDLVTEVDKACEALIVGAIERERPGDAVLAEEGGGHDRADARWRWVVDPLDGTTNYAHGYPRFAVSIGVECEGVRQVGVVYDPLLDECFHATRGGGAFRNGHAIRVSDERDLGQALLATGFAYDVRRAMDDNVENFGRMIKAARAVRRDGSAALDLCYVAAGRFDGFWEFKLSPWDVAAGLLLVEEAGGRCSDAGGAPADPSGRQTVATNGWLHDAMLELIRPGG
ncbi:MAG: inositol monophosphatase [Proteobacteria bacterium]|nr:inositol monophosphatase [Pseudomonadota bacterium]